MWFREPSANNGRRECDFIVQVLTGNGKEANNFLKKINCITVEKILEKQGLLLVFYYQCGILSIQDKICFVRNVAAIFQKNLARNLKLEKVFRDVFQIAQEAGIQILPLKGINLIHDVYPHPGMRSLADIDILCREQEIDSLTKLLCQNGFTVSALGDNCGLSKTDSYSESHILIEIHPNMVPPRPYQIACDVFSRARSDNAVSYLSQEDLFLNLMLNMRRDLRELTVRYIYDLYMIVADSKYFDWRYIRELCERNRLMKLFYFSLNALWVLFGYKPPEKISGLVYRGFNRYHFFYWRKRYGYFMRLKVMDSFGEFAMYGREKIKSRIRKRKLNKRAYESTLHCIK